MSLVSVRDGMERSGSAKEGIAMENTTTMTETAVFDTLAVARDLERAGFDRGQAEALARALAAVQGNLATKEAVANLRRATKEDIASLRRATKEDIANLKENLVQLELRLESKIETLRTIMLAVFLPLQLTLLALVLPPYFGG